MGSWAQNIGIFIRKSENIFILRASQPKSEQLLFAINSAENSTENSAMNKGAENVTA